MNLLPLNDYDHYIVFFSGGKDSLAVLLNLIDQGVDKSKVELWHHDIDGREGSRLMDWPCTRDYCRKVAGALGLKIYYSWRQGGFEREMNRNESLTAPVSFETPDGLKQSGGTTGKPNTRLKFPQVSADLSVRWCSAYLKIDVCSIALSQQTRFDGKKILVLSGERAEESTARAGYAEVEEHRRNCNKRLVHQWRSVHAWSRYEVWEIIGRWKINPHPAYRLGFGRVSCMKCIFGSANQWASVRQIDPEGVEAIADYEGAFGKTIHRTKTVHHLCQEGTPYDMKRADITAALSETFDEPVIMDTWAMPAGAFGESCGPT